MSDQKKWFKVWNSILTDPSFLDLPVEQVGRWTLLGALISLHGENGKITLSKDSLYKLLRVKNDNGLMLPNVVFEEGQGDNGTITVIMKNWLKYQLDSTGYKRLKKFRKSKMITVQEKTKIRLREDKNKPIAAFASAKAAAYSPEFILFWNEYPPRNGKKTLKKEANQEWRRLNPGPELQANLLLALKQQKQNFELVRSRGDFAPEFPDACRWLKKRRWEDEVQDQKENWIEKVRSIK